MNIEEYLVKENKIYEKLLEYLDDNDTNNEKRDMLLEFFHINDIQKNRDELYALLHLLSTISMNHHRIPNFLSKIEQILSFFEVEIKQSFSNFKIFDIFKRNKLIILLLIEKKLIIPDQEIADFIKKSKYNDALYNFYFFPEFQTFLKNDRNNIKEEIAKLNINSFNEKRKIGENDEHICYLIRNDMVDEFISFIEKKSIKLTSTINKSIFETNTFLMCKEPTLIEYAAFFGSINIFQYLLSKKADLSQSLLIYAVHGRKIDIIQFICNNNRPKVEILKECIIESIKCHYNEIVDFMLNNVIQIQIDSEEKILLNCLKYSNYRYFPSVLNLYKAKFVYYLCKYNYAYIFEMLISIEGNTININDETILKFNCL